MLFEPRQIFYSPDPPGGDPPPAPPVPPVQPDTLTEAKATVAALKADLAIRVAENEKMKGDLVSLPGLQDQSKKMIAVITSALDIEYAAAPEFIKTELTIEELKKDPLGGLLTLRQTIGAYARIRADIANEKNPPPDPTAPKPGGDTVTYDGTRVGALKLLANLQKDK